MPGPDPGIHAVLLELDLTGDIALPDDVDGRVKPGHDE
jgi:hypothetical protein